MYRVPSIALPVTSLPRYNWADLNIKEISKDEIAMALSVRHVHLILQRAIKERKDPELITYAEQQRKDGFGWRYDGLGDWSTDDVFTKLRELGIDTDADQFYQQAETAQSCKNLWEGWRETVDLEDSPWDDFPFLAAEELWRRLAPDLVCPEFIADRLSAAILTLDDPGRGNPKEEGEDVAAALQTVDYLERFPSAQRAARFDELLECTTYDLSGWLLEFVSDYAEEHLDAVVRVADVMSEADPGNAANFQGDLAVVLAMAGEDLAAQERIRANLERFPDDVWIRIKAGDAYGASGRDEDALRFYVEAMHRAEEEYDWDGAEERILPVLRLLGREHEYSQIIRKFPRPSERRLIGHLDNDGNIHSIDSRTGPSLRIQSVGPKTGRNDPCPCGSGKKYKKCCLGRD